MKVEKQRSFAQRFLSWIKAKTGEESGKKTGTMIISALGMLGVLLLVIPSFLPAPEKEQAAAQQQIGTDYAQEMSQRLETTLGCIEGVGRIRVMVTLSRESESVFATDDSSDMQSGTETSSGQKEQKHVILEKQGAEEALVATRITPQIQGVIIVCTGGDDPVVAARLTEAVTAVLGLGPSRIAVSKMETITGEAISE